MKRPDIEGILRRHRAARSGSWAVYDARVWPAFEDGRTAAGTGEANTSGSEICDTSTSRHPRENAEFIAHAKTDVIDLIHYIEELERKYEPKARPTALDSKTERALAPSLKYVMPCGCAWGTLLCPH